MGLYAQTIEAETTLRVERSWRSRVTFLRSSAPPPLTIVAFASLALFYGSLIRPRLSLDLSLGCIPPPSPRRAYLATR